MNNATYNGWTNYATWRVNLEICDDYLAGIDEPVYPTTYALAHALEEYVTDYIIESTEEGVAQDYALAFVDQVNWYEIAEHNTELIASEEEDMDAA